MYTCNGKRTTHAEQIEKAKERVQALRSQAEDLRKDLRGPITAKITEIEEKIKKLSETPDKSSRPGCGYNMTDIIKAIPDDGDVYTYTCPKCGNEGTARKLPPEKTEV